jgi:hypothetical protein
VSPRRRPRWPEYQNDNDPFADRDTPAWPTVAPHAAPQVEKAEAAPHAPLVSQEALADRLDVSIATLARQRKKGRLLGHRVGGQWRYSEQQIADYLKLTEPPLRLYGRRTNDNDQS